MYSPKSNIKDIALGLFSSKKKRTLVWSKEDVQIAFRYEIVYVTDTPTKSSVLILKETTLHTINWSWKKWSNQDNGNRGDVSVPSTEEVNCIMTFVSFILLFDLKLSLSLQWHFNLSFLVLRRRRQFTSRQIFLNWTSF